MNRVLAIALKDLRSTLAQHPGAGDDAGRAAGARRLCSGFAFGGGGSGFTIAATKVAVANLDKRAGRELARGASPAGRRRTTVVGIIKSPELKDILTVTRQVRPRPRRARASTTARRPWR